jgi:hypothetical protein
MRKGLQTSESEIMIRTPSFRTLFSRRESHSLITQANLLNL